MDAISIAVVVGDPKCETPGFCDDPECYGCIPCGDFRNRDEYCDYCAEKHAANQIDSAEGL